MNANPPPRKDANSALLLSIAGSLLLALALVLAAIAALPNGGEPDNGICDDLHKGITSNPELSPFLKEGGWKVELPKDGSMLIRHPKREASFAVKKAEINPVFKGRLEGFIPKLWEYLAGQDDGVVWRIAVEGHASREWQHPPNRKFSRNMKLSIDRAYAVFEFLSDVIKSKCRLWPDLASVISVDGFSSSLPLDEDGNPTCLGKDGKPISASCKMEDPEMSRRVEFRLFCGKQPVCSHPACAEDANNPRDGG